MKRINLIASLTKGAATVLDIGCDHAYTIIKAITEYGVKKGIGADINEGPLKIAKTNIEEKKLEDKIKLVLSDGFDKINDSFDTLVISGMGGVLMCDILERGMDKIKGKKLVISANSDFYLVRKYLTAHGFIISDEYSLHEDGIYYEVAVFEPGNHEYASFELKYGPVLLKKKEEDYITEYKKRLEKLEGYLPTIKDTILKDEKLVIRNEYFKILLGDTTPMITIPGTDNYYREYFLDDKPRPLIIVSAGGGYKYTSPRESEPVAEFYNQHGYHAVIVNYREDLLPYPAPQNALAYVFNLYKKDERAEVICGIGFSAGGHNLLEVALHPELYGNPRIDYMIQGYPVVTSDSRYWHKGSFKNLLNAEPEGHPLQKRLSLENEVTEKAPEMFIWGTFTDESVNVMNSLLLIEAYKKVNVNCEYHMYPMGGHGLSLATENTSGGDKKKEIPYVSVWAEDSVKWLNEKIKFRKNG